MDSSELQAHSSVNDPEVDLHARINNLEQDIRSLQAAAQRSSKPWYRDTSTIISTLALLFSFGTTYVSYRRTEAQDVQVARQELRGILQRLSAIPRDNLEAMKKYQGDGTTQASFGSYYNEENSILSQQAAEIAKELPDKVVTASEYYAVANALQSAYNLAKAKEFFELAQKNATDFNIDIAAQRASANLDYFMGQVGAGRAKYEEATRIFAKYTGYDPYTMGQTNATTQLQWATSEANQGQWKIALEHLDNAQHLVEGLPTSPMSDQLGNQIRQTRDLVTKAMASVASPSGITSPQAPTSMTTILPPATTAIPQGIPATNH